MNHLQPAGYFELSESNDKTLVFPYCSATAQPYYFYYAHNERTSRLEEPSDKRKVESLERSVYELIDSSAEAAAGARNNLEDTDQLALLALAKAREAVAALDSLKAAIALEQRPPSSQYDHDTDGEHVSRARQTQPMTTGANLSDLTIMVKSNLAAQLQRSNYLKEALDLYIQLCKMAGNSSGLGGSLIMSMDSASDSANQQLGSRFWLHRFGINIGNIHFEMEEYQRALKYYRLTLDRLTSSPGNQQLKIKLMNNISLALISLGQSSGKPSIDSVNSLNYLLMDNLAPSTAMLKSIGSNEATQTLQSQAVNSNHHQYVLNLMVCLYLRSELRRMIKVLEDNVDVHISKSYKRLPSQGADSLELTNQSVAPVDITGDLESDDKVSSSYRFDVLENVIREKETQTYRCLKMSCKLILDLANRSAEGKSKSSSDEQAVFKHCLKVLSSSNVAKVLTLDLKTDSVLQMLSKRSGLQKAASLFQDVFDQECEQQADERRPSNEPVIKQRTKSASSTMQKSIVPAETDKTMRLPDHETLNSTIVLSICGILHSLRGQPDKALEVCKRALALDRWDKGCWINLGNCHQFLANCEQAEHCYKQALLIEPDCWIAHYNLVQLSRKFDRNYDDLGAATRQRLVEKGQAITRSLYRNMILLPVQVGFLYLRSGMDGQSQLIFDELMDRRRKCPPEVQLSVSKALLSNQDRALVDGAMHRDGDSRARARPKPLQLLESANRDHAYHLPLAGFLIALYIENFDYKAAERVLAECIKNRPDQVKWYQMLAECHRHSADYKRAMSVYKLASELFPLDTGCLKALVKLTDELGLDDENQLCQARLARALQNKRNLTTAPE